MDLNTITEVARPRNRSEMSAWSTGDAWLAGGTWLFSEPQPALSRLIDLSGLNWPATVVSPDGLEIAATCTVAALDALTLPPEWAAAPLIGQCCRAFLASFKIWNMATVGGNICLALPAASMTSLTAALDGIGTVWMPDGQDRRERIVDLVTGAGTTSLLPGEVLRQIDIPAEAMLRRTGFRQVSLTRHGRSGVLLIGTSGPDGFVLTVTASTPRPIQLQFKDIPDATELASALDRQIPAKAYFDDMHGRPDWRRHVTGICAEEIRRELAS
jgi:CO/xanthine dehydrogenase FAD-binding subunit